MGLVNHLKQLWRKPQKTEVHKRLIQWRREPVCQRIERPTRLDRARALGYRAKPGIFIVRVRNSRGGHTRPWRTKGRRSKAQTRNLTLRKNYRLIAEERAEKAFVNCEVLNSYPVARDGKYIWHEVIMVDRKHPSVVSDHRTKWISGQRGRASRGITSAGKKVRGLHHKGKGTEKARPSRRSNSRRQ